MTVQALHIGCFLSVLLCLFPAQKGYSGTEESVPLSVIAAEYTSIEAKQSTFKLIFNDFISGSKSSTASVVYAVSANNVRRERDLVMARIDQPLAGIALETDFSGYADDGGHAILVRAQNGYATLGTTDIGLAHKQITQGSGKKLQGKYILTYRATALEDLPAGIRNAVITVTFVDN